MTMGLDLQAAAEERAAQAASPRTADEARRLSAEGERRMAEERRKQEEAEKEKIRQRAAADFDRIWNLILIACRTGGRKVVVTQEYADDFYMTLSDELKGLIIAAKLTLNIGPLGGDSAWQITW